MKQKHAQLQDVAIGWLYGVGCSIFAKEVPTVNGVADALGIKTRNGKNDVYYIEAKASRSDLICKKQKEVYAVATGTRDEWCWQHHPDMYRSMFADQGVDRTQGWENCPDCKALKMGRGDTGIDFYYLIVADGVKIEPALYPAFGVISEHGKIIRKATRMRRDDHAAQDLIIRVAHRLVYQVYGKLYVIDGAAA